MRSAVETRTAHIGLTPEGILITRIQPGIRQSLEDAQENLRVLLEVGAGVRRPLLVDIRRSELLSAEARHFYTGRRMTDGFVALALLIEATPVGRTMGNIFLRIARPGISMRLFTGEDHAVAWLRQQVP